MEDDPPLQADQGQAQARPWESLYSPLASNQQASSPHDDDHHQHHNNNDDDDHAGIHQDMADGEEPVAAYDNDYDDQSIVALDALPESGALAALAAIKQEQGGAVCNAYYAAILNHNVSGCGYNVAIKTEDTGDHFCSARDDFHSNGTDAAATATVAGGGGDSGATNQDSEDNGRRDNVNDEDDDGGEDGNRKMAAVEATSATATPLAHPNTTRDHLSVPPPPPSLPLPAASKRGRCPESNSNSDSASASDMRPTKRSTQVSPQMPPPPPPGPSLHQATPTTTAAAAITQVAGTDSAALAPNNNMPAVPGHGAAAGTVLTQPMANNGTASMVVPVAPTAPFVLPNTVPEVPVHMRKPPPRQAATTQPTTTTVAMATHSLSNDECAQFAHREAATIGRDSERLLTQYLALRDALGNKDPTTQFTAPIPPPRSQKSGWLSYCLELQQHNEKIEKAIQDGKRAFESAHRQGVSSQAKAGEDSRLEYDTVLERVQVNDHANFLQGADGVGKNVNGAGSSTIAPRKSGIIGEVEYTPWYYESVIQKGKDGSDQSSMKPPAPSVVAMRLRSQTASAKGTTTAAAAAISGNLKRPAVSSSSSQAYKRGISSRRFGYGSGGRTHMSSAASASRSHTNSDTRPSAGPVANDSTATLVARHSAADQGDFGSGSDGRIGVSTPASATLNHVARDNSGEDGDGDGDGNDASLDEAGGGDIRSGTFTFPFPGSLLGETDFNTIGSWKLIVPPMPLKTGTCCRFHPPEGSTIQLTSDDRRYLTGIRRAISKEASPVQGQYTFKWLGHNWTFNSTKVGGKTQTTLQTPIGTIKTLEDLAKKRNALEKWVEGNKGNARDDRAT